MENVVVYAQEKVKYFKTKADLNKLESLFCYMIIIICSLTAPLFISLAEGKFLSKITPSILSCISAGLTSWVQLRKPQKLWSTYRNAQRLIENEIIHFNYLIGDYQNTPNASTLLIDRVTSVAMNTHKDWTSIIPNSDNVSDVTK